MDTKSNFDFLNKHSELLAQLAQTAEASFVSDPNTTMVKLRQLGEAIAKDIAARVGIEVDNQTKQIELLNLLRFKINLNGSVLDSFHQVRKIGNKATHDFTSSSHRDAIKALRIAWTISVWYHLTFGGDKAKGFKKKPFVNPVDPSQHVRELEDRIRILEKSQKRSAEHLKISESLQQAQKEKLEAEKLRADEMEAEREVWEALATEAETKLVALVEESEEKYKLAAESFNQKEDNEKEGMLEDIARSPFDISEAETRLLIDQQLLNSGWLADTENHTYAKGARPEQSVCQAIAEWPTKTGPADYVLFDGLIPVAIIEAKKKIKSVYSDIDQAKRYSAGFQTNQVCEIPITYGEFKVPFVFATNGRPYLRQLEQESGIWFLDVREPTNQRRALQGWYTPEAIRERLRTTISEAEKKLQEMDFSYGFTLRPYQIDAIQSVEQSIQNGDLTSLVAMATGTGKTKTAIALVYRLLKSERFRRILFLVDRTSLGEQAADSFSETRMENMNTFADIFDVKDLTESKPDSDTKVHIATVQGMVKRVLYSEDNEAKPSISDYDCIVVDECHRGYLLDREMSDTELSFRDQSDYISKYRTVIEYFDAYKIGLTATPALHTSQIFGEPVFNYSYTEAVVDGFLIDHEPPIRIETKLSRDGIHYQVNEEVQVYDVQKNELSLVNTPDELDFEVTQFNRSVINENFNRAVIEHLIEKDQIDPLQDAKTLVFCVTDKHADMVVRLFKEVSNRYHGEISDDAIQKITGTSDKPLTKIRYFKNDRFPNIAVTVDLLTTGIDVPKITTLVFLRRVNSRILFEQMMGRATRRCDEIGKETFRVFDAVDIYHKLEKANTMKPVATSPNLTFSKLEQELAGSTEKDVSELVRDQFAAKLHRKKRHLTEEQTKGFEAIAGQTPEEFLVDLRAMRPEEAALWFVNNPGLGEILDARFGAGTKSIVISDHHDEVVGVHHGYGDNVKPEDYLDAFAKFVNANSNRMPALQLVIQRPWELTRRSLKELAVELEKHSFREQDLKTAWHDVTNEEIAARIMGFIRQASIGEALIPWEQRVENALELILNLQNWTTPQKKWIQAIAKQTVATTIVDKRALDNGVLKDQYGGLRRANKLFDNQAENVLNEFKKALWT